MKKRWDQFSKEEVTLTPTEQFFGACALKPPVKNQKSLNIQTLFKTVVCTRDPEIVAVNT